MKTLKRIVALLGIAMGAGALCWAALYWWLISCGPPMPDNIPFVWTGEMTWKGYAFVATLAMLGIGLVVVSFRFGFRRHAEPVASPSGGPAGSAGDSRVSEGPP